MQTDRKKTYPIEFVHHDSWLVFVKQTVFGKKSMAIYRCRCGKGIEKRMNSVRTGNVKSCGCRNVPELRGLKHGLSKHPLYIIWKSIKNRCYLKKNKEYRNYGAIGVKMCDEWLHNPEKFILWGIANGWQLGLEIDKDILSKKLGLESNLYSPETCCFITHQENNRHKRSNVIIEYNGKKQTLTEWSKELNISQQVLGQRLKRHHIKDAFETKSFFKNRMIKYNGEEKSVAEWSRFFSMSYGTLYGRIHVQKLSLEEAISIPANYNSIINFTKNKK